jgi:hypothetical protein
MRASTIRACASMVTGEDRSSSANEAWNGHGDASTVIDR